jgi:hypothetical protein
MAKVFPFSELATADLVIDAIYEGGVKGNVGDDPLGKLIPGAGNQGGFRQVGGRGAPQMALLYSSLDDPEWPDFVDVATGVFTYFGDNKKPGFALHDTTRGGNKLLYSCFARLHSSPDERKKIPPFFVFTKHDPGFRDHIEGVDRCAKSQRSVAFGPGYLVEVGPLRNVPAASSGTNHRVSDS